MELRKIDEWIVKIDGVTNTIVYYVLLVIWLLWLLWLIKGVE